MTQKLRRDWGPALPGVLLAVLVFVAYLPALRGEFLWDDDSNIVKRAPLRTWTGLLQIWLEPGATQQYYPLTHTSFWLDYHLWGLHPFGYHVENVLLHAASAVLLWRILRQLRVPGAWLGAALFALHPVGVESVAWITERKNTLSGVFFLSAMLASLKFWRLDARLTSPPESAPHGPWKLYGISLLLYLGALWSKTSTVGFPVVVALLLWWKRGKVQRRDVLLLLPFVALGVLMGLVTMWIERHNLGATGIEWGGVSRLERGLIAGRALWFYLGKLLWPHPLMFMYPRWNINAADLPAYVPAAAVIAAFLLLWRKHGTWARPVLAALGCFVVLLFPVLGFFNGVFFLYSFVCDHFQYLACIGPLALLAAAITRALAAAGRDKPFLQPAVNGSLLLLLGILTWRQTLVYQNVEILWRDTLAHNPDSWMAHDNLGTWLSNNHHFDEAREHYLRAIALRPSDHMAYNDLGLDAARQGHEDEAIQNFNHALEIFPGYALGYYNLGRALAAKGDLDAAALHLSKALELDPGLAAAHFTLGNILDRKGDHDAAIEHYTTTLQLEPDFAPAHAALGRVLAAKGKLDEAITHYREALAIDPASVEALANLANALLAQGRFDEAVDSYRAALRLNPSSPVLHHNLAVALERQGHHAESQDELNQAARLQAGAAPTTSPP